MNQSGPSGHYFAVVRSLDSDLYTQWGFSGGTSGKEPSSQSRRLRFDPWVRKGMATYSSILAWRIPWLEEPGGLQSIGSQRVI